MVANHLRQKVPGWPRGPPLGRGVSYGAVASQVKGDTGHVEKTSKNIWEIQKSLEDVLDYYPKGALSAGG
jgi:hypothetical protein